MIWANFIHIYQPPTQKQEIVEKVADESYKKIVEIFGRYPDSKITLNISSVLTEQLQRYGLTDIIDKLEDLAKNGQIEFTGSAKYHPILPLIDQKEAVRQIELNEKTNREIIGNVYKPVGFFPPEMCYSRKIADIVESLGYKWIIMDEIGYNGKIGQVSKDVICSLAQSDLNIFFKERKFSSGLTYGRFLNGEDFEKALAGEIGAESYLLTGTDGEIYGHHRKGQEKLLEDIFESKKILTSKISELIDRFRKRQETEPLPSSWSTWEDEMAADIPYPQWKFPGNTIHEKQWALAQLAVEAIQRAESKGKLSPESESRRSLDEGLHSDQWWWASCRPWWDVGMIREGTLRLLNAVKSASNSAEPGTVEKAQRLADGIKRRAERLHETGDAKRLQNEYMETHKDVTTLLTFG